MHGGAPGSGAPRGNKNALKHGAYTREAIERRRGIREFIQKSRDLVSKMSEVLLLAWLIGLLHPLSSNYFPRPFLLLPSFGTALGPVVALRRLW